MAAEGHSFLLPPALTLIPRRNTHNLPLHSIFVGDVGTVTLLMV